MNIQISRAVALRLVQKIEGFEAVYTSFKKEWKRSLRFPVQRYQSAFISKEYLDRFPDECTVYEWMDRHLLLENAGHVAYGDVTVPHPLYRQGLAGFDQRLGELRAAMREEPPCTHSFLQQIFEREGFIISLHTTAKLELETGSILQFPPLFRAVLDPLPASTPLQNYPFTSPKEWTFSQWVIQQIRRHYKDPKSKKALVVQLEYLDMKEHPRDPSLEYLRSHFRVPTREELERTSSK